MRSGVLPETVARLPWVRPHPAALLALADDPAEAVWSRVRHDAGLVLLLLRHSPADWTTALASADFLDLVLHHLSADETLVAPGLAAQEVRDWSLRYAATAEQLARATQSCDPDQAWIAGLLAPLGWLALADAAPAWVQACRADDELDRDPLAVQCRLWGLEHAALVRRLARHWGLPDWLSTVIGNLALPAGTAAELGAEAGLFTVVQQAVRQVQTADAGLHLAVCSEQTRLPTVAAPTIDAPAGDIELSLDTLRRLLRLTAENRRLRQEARVERLEGEIDQLHRLLEQRPEASMETFQTLKLRALAEFAAGAGHEINNPLAIISGQVQYLLGYETDPARRKPMETIIAQTQRIHRLLRDVMQFARPTPPRKQPLTLWHIVEKAAAALQPLAQDKKVNVELREPDASVPQQVQGDPAQLESIVSAVLRNAIEAAGVDGWARLYLVTGPGQAEVHVEDSGPGLTPIQRDHLFDPFYSGRDAGRGAGLGLSLAWALVRNHDGEIALTSSPGETTHFVVRLPRFETPSAAIAS